MTTKVSIVAANPSSGEQVARDIREVEAGAELRVQAGGASAACTELIQHKPDLIVVELAKLGQGDLARLEEALVTRPRTSMILLTPDRSPEALLGAMRAGVREVVPTPLANGELKAAYQRQVERLRAGSRRDKPDGQVLAFMPVKGGAGATFLATSFAHALSCRGRRVAVIDLNLHLGDAAIFVSDQPVTASIADLCQQEQRLDGALVESVMMPCAKNLWLLASPETPDAAVGVRAETVSRIIALARTRFDYVVLDTGRVPDAVTLCALDAAKTVYLIAQTTLPFLHDGKRLMSLLRDLGYPPEKFELVINRVEKGGDLSPDDVRETLHMPVAREIPNSYSAVAHAINHGLPLLRHLPRDPVARALKAWSEELEPEVRAEAGLGGWFRGLGRSR